MCKPRRPISPNEARRADSMLDLRSTLRSDISPASHYILAARSRARHHLWNIQKQTFFWFDSSFVLREKSWAAVKFEIDKSVEDAKDALLSRVNLHIWRSVERFRCRLGSREKKVNVAADFCVVVNVN